MQRMEHVHPMESPKLAAILAIDAVGYSRLMRDNEVRTLSDLKAVRMGVIEPAVVAHNGRLFKAMGDGFLLEFGSVGNAVQCAIDIQQKILVLNASHDQEQNLEFRMGLNVADIIPDSEDVYGDGANIAVRLEALAKPSEICISGAVYEQIRHTFGDVFRRLGRKTLKNIDMPIEVYSARIGASSRQTVLNRLLRIRGARQSIVAGCAAILLVAGVGSLFVTEFEWSFSFDGKSAASEPKQVSMVGSDAVKADDQAAVARIEASGEAAAAKAKAEAVKAKAKAEASTVTAEAKANEQVVKSALDAWKDASLALTEATKALSEAEAKLAELEGQAAALNETGSAATENNDNARQLAALTPRIRDAQEDLGRVKIRYESSVTGERRARDHLEKLKAEAHSPDG